MRSLTAGGWRLCDYDTLPREWKPWIARKEPIDIAVQQLIDKNRLLDKAALAAAGIPCPFWYARSGVVLAAETAKLAVSEVVSDRAIYKQNRDAIAYIITAAPKIIEQLEQIATSSNAFDAGSRLHPRSQHNSAMFIDDNLFDRCVRSWNAFSIDSETLAKTLQELSAIAKIIHQGASNNLPNEYNRTFARKVQQSFQTLTGATKPIWRGAFVDYLQAARASARLPEISGEALLKKLNELDRTK